MSWRLALFSVLAVKSQDFHGFSSFEELFGHVSGRFRTSHLRVQQENKDAKSDPTEQPPLGQWLAWAHWPD